MQLSTQLKNALTSVNLIKTQKINAERMQIKMNINRANSVYLPTVGSTCLIRNSP